MAVVTAAITGAASLGLGAAGLVMGKNAANNQRDATLQATQMQIDERRRITEQGVAAAQMSPEEIKSINSLLATKGAALTSTMDSINKQQGELDAMDPNVKAAGSELYNLMTGQAAKILEPMQKKITQQRNERMNQLASQYGPGFMATSAGIEAMNKFDIDSSLALGNAQQSALGQMTQTYLGLSGQQLQGQAGVTSDIGNAFARAADIDKTVLGANQNVQNRITNATLGSATAQPVDFMAPAVAAGNQTFANSLGDLAGGLGKTAGALYGQNLFADKFGNNNGTGSGVLNTGGMSASDFGKDIGNTFATGKAG